MNKFLFYSNEKLKKKIEFKKLGVIIRNLNEEEMKEALSVILE